MLARIYNESGWISEIENLEIAIEIETLLKRSEFAIFGSIDHSFSPYGYTKLWLLGESHLAIHTFPEEKILYIELSSCIEEKAKLFWRELESWATKNSKNVLSRQKNEYKP